MYGIAQLGTRLVGYLQETLGGAPKSTLMNGLVSYWRLDEQSGTRVDAIGGNDLTDNNTVGYSCKGPTGTVASFVATNSEALSIGNDSNLSIQTGDFTFAVWINHTINLDGFVVMHGDSFVGYNWDIYQDGAGNNVQIRVWAGAGVAGSKNISGLTPGWHLLVAGRSGSNVFISIDGGVLQTSSAGSPTQTSPASFALGASCHANGSYGFSGLTGSMAAAGIWGADVTAHLVTLFNGGTALKYADLPAALKTGLVSFWNLDETGGVRYDSHGTNDLTDNNTVGSATAVNGAKKNVAASFVAANSEYLSKAAAVVPHPSTSSFSISVWLKSTLVASNGGIIGQYAGGINSFIIYESDNSLALYAIDNDGNRWHPDMPFSVFALDTSWHQVIMTHSHITGEGHIYVDGTLVGTDPLYTEANLGATWGDPFYVGSHTAASFPFDGQIDEGAIFSRVLTADERTELQTKFLNADATDFE